MIRYFLLGFAWGYVASVIGDLTTEGVGLAVLLIGVVVGFILITHSASEEH